MMICFDNGELKEDLYDLWHRVFHDPAAYMDFYFEEIYRNNQVLVDKAEESQIRGMIHMNPYTLLVREQPWPAHYIVGVAIREDCRRQGMMRRLLTAALSELRARGEILTYLMPADPNYYLPFGFRFGADWLEAELMVEQPAAQWDHLNYRNGPLEVEQAATAALRERITFTDRYSLATASDSGYLIRLEKEAASEHDKVYYLYDGEEYAGRFVVGVAEDYMMLSGIVCCMDNRISFLKYILKLCNDQYHYSAYHLTLDESWEEDIRELAKTKEIRLVSVKKKPMIMFRILNLEKTGSCLQSKADFQMSLYVTDEQLPDQAGMYLIEAAGEKAVITKVSEKRAGDQTAISRGNSGGQIENNITDGGKISIEDLTSIFFNRMEPGKTKLPSSLTEEGRRCLAMLIPFTNNSIMEYV